MYVLTLKSHGMSLLCPQRKFFPDVLHVAFACSLKGHGPIFQNFSFLFHLNNYHSKVVNLKFQLKRSISGYLLRFIIEFTGFGPIFFLQQCIDKVIIRRYKQHHVLTFCFERQKNWCSFKEWSRDILSIQTMYVSSLQNVMHEVSTGSMMEKAHL